MKIGDLVTLSAYGKKMKRAEWIEPGDVGIISKIRYWKAGNTPTACDYFVHWRKSDIKARYWHYERHNQRKDLKYVK